LFSFCSPVAIINSFDKTIYLKKLLTVFFGRLVFLKKKTPNPEGKGEVKI
tara:strand:+ start:2682 stop:2831 length:150 start_codon:yes stop_codon:yes gene_type:complete